MNLEVMSIEVLKRKWDELIRKFEKEESDQLIDALNIIENELNKRSEKSCSL
ncbi:hypothetical protein V7149_26380 [Bacillus sp. JJ1503]|uniref:hypothetical protein n=1 Tax=Bacillus sp. JJ1503 TaxID=3122956 RepID=UPI0030008A51